MEALIQSLQSAHEYPSNLVCSGVPVYYLDSTRREFASQSSRLFCESEQDAEIDVIELYQEDEKSSFRCIRNADELRKALDSPIFKDRGDPVRRIVFIGAPSSRDPLVITAHMMRVLLTYHQVMSEFVECLFSFGFREFGQECFMTTFQAQRHFVRPGTALAVPQLRRSARIAELCYGLRSVERTDAQPDWPWSARLCSLYHSLDLETGVSACIIIKANKLVEKLVQDAIKTDASNLGSDPAGTSFADALKIHETMTIWCGSNWAYYISFLEGHLQETTRSTLSNTLESEALYIPAEPFTDELPMYRNEVLEGKQPTRLKKISSSFRTFSSRVSTFREKSHKNCPIRRTQASKISRHQFSFKDLPRVHYIEEQANEALDILTNNDEILESLQAEYDVLFAQLQASTNRSTGDKEASQAAHANFVRIVNGVRKDLRVQRARVKQLLRLLKDRKSLLEGILDYEAMQANRHLAEKANKSAENMEKLAKDTKLETVSMRVITLVTLFFLPGTFISTLMSTPIVSFNPGSPATSDADISIGALGFFIAISVPLMAFTFAVWGLLLWLQKRKEWQYEPQEEAEGQV